MHMAFTLAPILAFEPGNSASEAQSQESLCGAAHGCSGEEVLTQHFVPHPPPAPQTPPLQCPS